MRERKGRTRTNKHPSTSVVVIPENGPEGLPWHSLLLLPGSAFGAPGYLRLSYGGLGDTGTLSPVVERLALAAQQLARGDVPATCHTPRMV